MKACRRLVVEWSGIEEVVLEQKQRDDHGHRISHERKVQERGGRRKGCSRIRPHLHHPISYPYPSSALTFPLPAGGDRRNLDTSFHVPSSSPLPIPPSEPSPPLKDSSIVG